jgi:acyl-coenzyme A synthetase/AMP-(fatty) acid ligase
MNLAQHVLGNRHPGRIALVCGDKQVAAAACEGLPRHKRPKWIRCFAELPRTATGKVQRYKLREILERELERSG